MATRQSPHFRSKGCDCEKGRERKGSRFHYLKKRDLKKRDVGGLSPDKTAVMGVSMFINTRDLAQLLVLPSFT